MDQHKVDIDGELFYIGRMLDENEQQTHEPREACTLIVSKLPEGNGKQAYWAIPIEKGSMEPEKAN